MRRIVSALLVRDGAVLLAKRSPAKRAYPNTWSFPGGHVEPGEALDAALVREVGEEVGLVPTCFRQMGTIEKLDPAASGAVTCHYQGLRMKSCVGLARGSSAIQPEA